MTSKSTTAIGRRRVARKVTAAAAVIAGVCALTLATAPGAQAEPFSNFASVGSDTIQYVDDAAFNSIAFGLVASYDASNPTTGINNISDADTIYKMIQTKQGATPIIRPGSSDDGFDALRAAKETSYSHSFWANTNTTANSIDFSRASSARKDTAGNAADLDGTYVNIPYTIDDLTYGVAAAGSLVGVDFTKAQLATLFNCDPAGVTIGTTIYSSTSNTSDATHVPVHPYLPKFGSGSRKDFLANIGYPISNPVDTALGTCIGVTMPADVGTSGSAGFRAHNSKIEEHDGAIFVADPAAISVFSAGQWLTQQKALFDVNGVRTATGTLPVTDRYSSAVKLGTLGADGSLVIAGNTTNFKHGTPLNAASTAIDTNFAFARVTVHVVKFSDLFVDPSLLASGGANGLNLVTAPSNKTPLGKLLVSTTTDNGATWTSGSATGTAALCGKFSLFGQYGEPAATPTDNSAGRVCGMIFADRTTLRINK